MYEFLDYESIALLENAILLGRLGLYDESLSIFENKLSEWMIVPVVVYEKAIVYNSQGKVRDAYTTLSSFLEDSSEDDLNLPVYRLLALFLGMVEISHRGQIERAVKEINRTRGWLQDVSVTSYTDVQVCLRDFELPILIPVRKLRLSHNRYQLSLGLSRQIMSYLSPQIGVGKKTP
jgi:hypothetical protein